ncbi:MAG: hypothetical protein ACREIV_01535 [Planctomycetaceae bacterium]
MSVAFAAVLLVAAAPVAAQRPSRGASSEPRQKIIVRLPVAEASRAGELVLEPNVEVAPASRLPFRPNSSHAPIQQAVQRVEAPPVSEPAPPPVPVVESPGVEWYYQDDPLGGASPLMMTEPGIVTGEPLVFDAEPGVVVEGGIVQGATGEYLFGPTPGDGVILSDGTIIPAADPMFGSLVHGACHPGEFHPGCPKCYDCEPSCFDKLFGHPPITPCPDIGIGHEMLPYAHFTIDHSEPGNYVTIRLDSADRWDAPDRAEYFWAAPPRGPEFPELSVDYQELHFIFELGGERFSVQTDIPLRVVDPVINPDTSGLGDIRVLTKTVLIDGDTWQLTQVMHVFTPTGNPMKGLGTGHTSLEPGAVWRYKQNEWTFFHLEVTYWFALGGHPEVSGQVLKHAYGVSHIAYETDCFAILPTFELINYHILDGATTGPGGLIIDLDNEWILNVQPGVRFVLGPRSDLGLFEIGVTGAAAVSPHAWYETMFRVDFRWFF